MIRANLRRAEPSDEAFLARVYAETRREELAPLGWSEQQEEAFCRMQFRFQTQAYATQFPDADNYIVEFERKSAGRMIVNRADVEIRLVDVALLPEFRGNGIGAFLLRELQAEAASAGKPLALQVLKTNRQAARLYRRCGFVADGEDDLYLALKWENNGKRKMENVKTSS